MNSYPIISVFFNFLIWPLVISFTLMFVLTPFRYLFVALSGLIRFARHFSKL